VTSWVVGTLPTGHPGAPGSQKYQIFFAPLLSLVYNCNQKDIMLVNGRDITYVICILYTNTVSPPADSPLFSLNESDPGTRTRRRPNVNSERASLHYEG